MISFQDFKKLDLRVGEVLEVEDLEGADSLYKVIVNIGKEKRQVLAGLKDHYPKEEMVGKKVIVLANLETKVMFGQDSEGMILAAGKEARLLTVDGKVENGAEVS